MGYIRHNAFIITASNIPDANSARFKAYEIFGEDQVSSRLIGPTINGYYSFFVGPDGSKEGWDESDKGDIRRAEFRRWLSEEPQSRLDWVEIRSGGDSGYASVDASSGIDEN